MYLPPGPTPPTPSTLDAFWATARAACPSAGLPPSYQVRWIGLDAATTGEILGLIRAGDKTGTFTLPWIVAHTDRIEPKAGQCIILIDFDGTPELLLRLTHVYQAAFGAMTNEDTAVDGSPVRDVSIWKPLHTNYWNALLGPYGLAVTHDMPVWVERFELVWDRVASGPTGR